MDLFEFVPSVRMTARCHYYSTHEVTWPLLSLNFHGSFKVEHDSAALRLGLELASDLGSPLVLSLMVSIFNETIAFRKDLTGLHFRIGKTTQERPRDRL